MSSSDTTEEVKTCSTCQHLPFFNTPQWPRKPRSWKLGAITQIRRRAASCLFCSFVTRVFEGICRPFFAKRPEKRARSRLAVYLVFEGRPWYAVAGIEAESLGNYLLDEVKKTYWLHLGEPTPDLQEPFICISRKPPARGSAEHWSLLPHHKSSKEAVEGLIDYELLRNWLRECRGSHDQELCGESVEFKRRLLSTKLIDVYTRKLVETSPDRDYLALSYVRGRVADKKNGRELNLTDRLPQTLEDAMTFTKAMRLQYLWVDALCIDHYDEDNLQAQIQQMDLIYECSLATIVAIDGTTINAGLAGVSRPLECTAQSICRTPNGQFIATFVDSVWTTQGSAPWDFRAWTFQEGLLSRRCFILDRHHIRMRCWKELFHDIMPPRQLVGQRIPTDQSNEFFWENGWALDLNEVAFTFTAFDALVSSYSRRQLTLQSDALNACKGILNKITRKTGVLFVWGIPMVGLTQALSWKAHQDNCIVLRGHGFPTWSWVGWKGRTEFAYFLIEAEDFEDEAKVRARTRHEELTNQWKTSVEDLRRREAKERVQRNPEAFVVTKGVSEFAHQGHHLRIASNVAQFRLRRLRHQGDPVPNLPADSEQPQTAIGDHWTLLPRQGSGSAPLLNLVGHGTRFEASDYFFHVHPEVSEMLEQTLQDQPAKTDARPGQEFVADFLFLRYNPAIRDHHTMGNWLHDLVRALLIIPSGSGDGTVLRIASVLIGLEDWIEAEPEGRVVTMV